MQNLLVIDTSMNACTVAVQARGEVFSLSENMARGQSERLIPMIMDVVTQAGLTLPDIDVYAATTGPGTFTGLRVGLATMRALAQIANKPTRAISTFDALLSSTDINKDIACVIIETKRADYYVQMPNGLVACMSNNDLINTLDENWVIIGDASVRFKVETGLKNSTYHLSCSSAQSLINCALKAIDVEKLEPLYLRSADVSVSRQKTAIIK